MPAGPSSHVGCEAMATVVRQEPAGDRRLDVRRGARRRQAPQGARSRGRAGRGHRRGGNGAVTGTASSPSPVWFSRSRSRKQLAREDATGLVGLGTKDDDAGAAPVGSPREERATLKLQGRAQRERESRKSCIQNGIVPPGATLLHHQPACGLGHRAVELLTSPTRSRRNTCQAKRAWSPEHWSCVCLGDLAQHRSVVLALQLRRARRTRCAR